jgi:predicted lipid-binding transport protein (Tim44 family)
VFEQKPAMGSIFGGSAAPVARPVINAPAWFNEQRFVEAARNHFQSLQQHWDANEMDKIAEFVTPQLLEFLKRERADLGDGFQSTYIDNLQVQLDGVDDRADKTIATLTFSGVSKTSRFDQGEVFSESWNMERPQGENQPWLVAGIRQNS